MTMTMKIQPANNQANYYDMTNDWYPAFIVWRKLTYEKQPGSFKQYQANIIKPIWPLMDMCVGERGRRKDSQWKGRKPVSLGVMWKENAWKQYYYSEKTVKVLSGIIIIMTRWRRRSNDDWWLNEMAASMKILVVLFNCNRQSDIPLFDLSWRWLAGPTWQSLSRRETFWLSAVSRRPAWLKVTASQLTMTSGQYIPTTDYLTASKLAGPSGRLKAA